MHRFVTFLPLVFLLNLTANALIIRQGSDMPMSKDRVEAAASGHLIWLARMAQTPEDCRLLYSGVDFSKLDIDSVRAIINLLPVDSELRNILQLQVFEPQRGALIDGWHGYSLARVAAVGSIGERADSSDH